MDIEWWLPMSVSNEISCKGYDVDILAVTPCASLPNIGIGYFLE